MIHIKMRKVFKNKKTKILSKAAKENENNK
jgi:hypothetical protein